MWIHVSREVSQQEMLEGCGSSSMKDYIDTRHDHTISSRRRKLPVEEQNALACFTAIRTREVLLFRWLPLDSQGGFDGSDGVQ